MAGRALAELRYRFPPVPAVHQTARPVEFFVRFNYLTRVASAELGNVGVAQRYQNFPLFGIVWWPRVS